MTDTALAKHPPMRPHRLKRDWRTAMAAVKRLREDKEDTSQVFIIMHALRGNAYAQDFHRLLETQHGGRIAYERVELAERLGDEAWRATFPAGSVGEAYANFLAVEHLSPQGLVDESHKGIAPEELDQRHPYAWFFRRVRDLHDVWHVLTGYGRDTLGEICLLAFSYQETHDLARAVMALGGFAHTHGVAGPAARKAILEARRRGKQVRGWLPAEDVEALMFEPLEDARRRLGLTPPVAYDAVPPDMRNKSIDK